MENKIEVGDTLAVAGADGKPSALVEVVGRIERADGYAYEVRVLGNKRVWTKRAGELFVLVPATSSPSEV